MADGLPTSVPPFTLTTGANDICGPVPSGKLWIIKEILLVNDDASPRGAKLIRRTAANDDFSLRPNGTSTALNKIPAEDVETWHMDLFLEAGERIRGFAEVGLKITAHVSLIEIELTD